MTLHFDPFHDFGIFNVAYIVDNEKVMCLFLSSRNEIRLGKQKDKKNLKFKVVCLYLNLKYKLSKIFQLLRALMLSD